MQQDYIQLNPGTSRLAIDVGGVLSCNDTDSAGRSVAQQLEASCPTVECAQTCRLLVELFGPDNTFILSKCKSKVQKATVQFLDNPIEGLEPKQSFLQFTNIPRRNVVFCMERTGGDTPVRLIPLLNDSNGPRVAADKAVGKGAIAATLGLTHLIDDREDCLLSFFWEGGEWISSQRTKSISKKRPNKKKVQDSSEAGCRVALVHFGDHAVQPTSERVASFATSRGCANVEQGMSVCAANWFPVTNWAQVKERFGLTMTNEGAKQRANSCKDG